MSSNTTSSNMDNNTIKLNIGAGDSKIPGFIPIDIKGGIDALNLPYATGSVDEVYSSHCLEHLHHTKTLKAVHEWVRVLKPGGRIRIAVPDFDKVLERHRLGQIGNELLSAWLHGTHDEDTDRHRAFLTRDQMEEIFRRCGLENIKDFEPEYDDCTKAAPVVPVGLNLEATKRKVEIKENPKVVMVLSTPRIGFMDIMDGIAETAKELGWPFMKWGGTEWGKGLTQAILAAIQKYDPDYIMCLDYDSVFTAEDCREMLRLMQENPDVGAMYPVEAHRHQDVPLGFDTGGTIVYRGKLTQVASGHFGCTILRRQMFETLPHPWFYSCPDPATGLWNGNNCDADITFWVLAALHGWSVCQANDVQIGHMELCVKWIKPKGIMWQPIQHYRKNGKPPNAQFDGEYWGQFNRSQQGVTNAASGISKRDDGEGVLPEHSKCQTAGA